MASFSDYTLLDKVRDNFFKGWDWFSLLIIPNEYVIKIKILRRLYRQYLGAKSYNGAHYIENVSLTPSELSLATNSTVEQIELHHFELLSNSEIQIYRGHQNNELERLWIDANGIKAISKNKYYWEGLETRIKRTKLIWVISGGIIVSSIICKTDTISIVLQKLKNTTKHKVETTKNQELHIQKETSSKVQNPEIIKHQIFDTIPKPK